MAKDRSRDTSAESNFGKTTQPNEGQINKINHKGKTLGAQHASHGDSGIEKQVKRPKGN